MLLQEKFPKLSDPEFYLDFASRYARAGEYFFDILEIWCSLLGILMQAIFTWLIFMIGVGDTREIGTIPFVYCMVIAVLVFVQIRILLHCDKERPRWLIARYYRDIARKDIYELEKAYRYARNPKEIGIFINNLQAFQKRFPIKENALVMIIYNQCLIARGEPTQPPRDSSFLEKLFPGWGAFFAHKPTITG